MNNPLDDPTLDPAVKDYLKRVSASMGKVPAERRDALLMELATHIEKLADDYRDKGLQPTSATAEALKMMGDARKTGRSCAKTWYQSTEPGSFWTAVGVAAVVGTVSSSLFHSAQMALSSLMTPDQHSAYEWPIIAATMLFARFCAGTIPGWFTPKGAVIATTSYALLISAVDSIAMFGSGLHANGNIQHDHMIAPMIISQAVGPVVAYVSAAIAGRVRMYRYAGI